MTEKVIKYTKDDLTILWKPEKCIHSAVCVKGLGTVFNPREKKWINMDGASTLEIRSQIDKCPSKALSYE